MAKLTRPGVIAIVASIAAVLFALLSCGLFRGVRHWQERAYACEQGKGTAPVAADQDTEQAPNPLPGLTEGPARFESDLRARLVKLEGDVSLGLASRDPQDAVGKAVCGEGTITSITKEGETYSGLLGTPDGVAVYYMLLGSPGEIVAFSRVRFCGRVYSHLGPALKAIVVMDAAPPSR